MRPHVENTRRRFAAATVRFFIITATLVLVGSVVVSCRRKPPDPNQTESPKPPTTTDAVASPDTNEASSPPDLSQCTQIEIEFLKTALDYVTGEYLPLLEPNDILSAEEIAGLRSTRQIVVDDKQTIEAFARKVASGKRTSKGVIRMETSAVINCFRGDAELVSFDLKGPDIYVLRGSYPKWTGFTYRGWVRAEMLTKELESFQHRGGCAMNLWQLAKGFQDHRRPEEPYPKADQWCDVLVPIWQKNYHSHWVEFRCPSLPDARCTYAMNPACEPNSPPDTVLLFETEAGWNQYGGPELFSFAHHDPHGGTVLLNDRQRTVKFIRTEEELKQLRWK